MKRKVMFSILLVAAVLVVIFCLAGVAQAATVPLGALGVVTGPVVLPNGMLQYQVDFAEGKDFGACHFMVKNGKVSAQFFDSIDKYRAAYPEAAAQLDAARLKPSRSATGVASFRRLDLTGAGATSALLTLHQRKVVATNNVGAEALWANCLTNTTETYTYDGTNVTAASYWAAMGVYHDYQTPHTEMETYSGPTCTIGGIPAANVLVTSYCRFRETGTSNYVDISTRTRGYGTGYGIASFEHSLSPGLSWHTEDSVYTVQTIY